MRKGVCKVLFLSRSNAARSLMAESCLASVGAGRFKVFSAGDPDQLAVQPSGMALKALLEAGFAIGGLRVKPWTNFSHSMAEQMDFVISLDSEILPLLPQFSGQPSQVLWHYPELGRDESSYKFYFQTLISLRRRMDLLVALHQRVESRADLRDELREMMV